MKFPTAYIEKEAKGTYALMALIIGVFIVQIYYNLFYGTDYLMNIIYEYGFYLDGLLAGKIWTFITSIFLHSNGEHLILNLMALFFFGKAVESGLGWRKLLVVFFAGGIFGNLAVLFANFIGIMPANIPTIGASGAIFALLGAAMFIKPLEFVFYPYLIPVPLVLVAILYTLFNIASFMTVLLTSKESQVAFIAHIGGVLFGMYYGFKAEGLKRGLLVMLLTLLILIALPSFFYLIDYLEAMNYLTPLNQLFGVLK